MAAGTSCAGGQKGGDMKGYLDVKELESYKKADIQKLARDLGVSDAGTIKEIAARCAAVEVDVPEDELTEEEKALFGAEQASREHQEAATEQKAAEEAGTAAGLVKVKAVTRFLDKQFNQIKDAGEAYSVSRERAAELVAAGVAEIVG